MFNDLLYFSSFCLYLWNDLQYMRIFCICKWVNVWILQLCRPVLLHCLLSTLHHSGLYFMQFFPKKKCKKRPICIIQYTYLWISFFVDSKQNINHCVYLYFNIFAPVYNQYMMIQIYFYYFLFQPMNFGRFKHTHMSK